MTAREIVGRLKGVKQTADGWMALCPVHGDTKPSLHITEAPGGKPLLYCHGAGCSYQAICDALGLNGQEEGAWAAIIATYGYEDENGKLLYQGVRMDPKDFRARAPDGDGWKWSIKGVRRVLYRLPEILSRPKDPVWIVEGEKDADRLVREGLLSTTNLGGAGKWRSEYTAALRGRTVYILPDNDQAGEVHANKVAQSLHGEAVVAKIVELPGLPVGGDVSDWLAEGHSVDELREIAEATAEWTPKEHRSHLSGQAGAYVYHVPAAGWRFQLRNPKVHSDGRLTTIVRAYNRNEERQPVSGTINLASSRTRTSLANDLEDLAPHGFWRDELEAMYVALEDRMLIGDPVHTLRGDAEPAPLRYFLEPLLHDRQTTVIYGAGESGKSLFGLLVAVLVSTGSSHPDIGESAPDPTPTLYLDWERSREENQRRLSRISQGLSLEAVPEVKYRKQRFALAQDVEALASYIDDEGIGFVVVDSLLLACGAHEGRDPASASVAFFTALSELSVTALVIAHHGKDRSKGIYQSIFNRNCPSSVWEVRTHVEPGRRALSLSFFHDKANIGGRQDDFGVRFAFNDSERFRGPITVHKGDVHTPASGDRIALPERIHRLLLKSVDLSASDIADELEASKGTVKARLSELRKEGKVNTRDGKWHALTSEEIPF